MIQPFSQARRLLIVSYYVPPTSAVAVFRMIGFAQHLPACGWQVGFVAPPSMPHEPIDEALSRRLPPGTQVFSAPFPRSLPARLAGKFVNQGVWLPRALPALANAVRIFQPDAVMTSGPPHCVHLLGWFLKLRYNLPWATCLRDPWHTNVRDNVESSDVAPVVLGWGPHRWLQWLRWAKFCEARVFRNADCIIANTPLGCQGLQDAYPELRDKITFVTNGFDPESFPPPRSLVPLNGRLTILHAGEVYYGRDPRPLFDALKSLENMRTASQSPVRVRFLGQSTDHRIDMASAIRERNLENVVELKGQVPYASALEAMTQADVLLLLDTPGRKIGIPAKIYEYLGAGRPILALTEPDGDLAWVLRESGIPHRIAPPKNPEKILQALMELRNGLQEKSFAPPSPAQLERFTRAKLAQDLGGHLDRMLPGNAAKLENSFFMLSGKTCI